MFTKLIQSILVATMLTVAVAGDTFAKPVAHFPYHEIESWRDAGMVFVVRDADGRFVAHAKGRLEKWTSETQMVWVVRDDEGRFLTYARGQLERWADGTTRLVLRNKEGKFVAIGRALLRAGSVTVASDAQLVEALANIVP
jgi:hypothetical protein